MDERGIQSTEGVRTTLMCVECGYDLTGLPSSGKCPECGVSVLATIERPRYTADNRAPVPAWLRRAKVGAFGGFAAAVFCRQALFGCTGTSHDLIEASQTIGTLAALGGFVVHVVGLRYSDGWQWFATWCVACLIGGALLWE
jgi:hypothetical protein